MGWFSGFAKILYRFVKEVAKEVVKDIGKYVFKELPRRVRDWWNGKKIAVIGPTAAGKNCLYHRLKGEPIPIQHVHTRGAERVPAFTFKQQLPDGTEFEIYCKRSVNIGGETDERERHWIDACDDADVVFYMIPLSDLRCGRFRTGERIHDDLKWLAAAIGKLKSNTRVHFLVNKIDLELVDGAKYDQFVTGLRENMDELEATAKAAFGPYKSRLTGISPTSMKDDHLFAISFPLALKAVYAAVHTS